MEETKETLKEIIMRLMHESRWNRNSDYALYADYIGYCRPEISRTSYYDVMSNHKHYGLASFKTVERIRREIQEKARQEGNESLLSDELIRKYRKELEQEYHREYASKE